MTKDGKDTGMGRIQLVDCIGAVVVGGTGSAPNTVFLESAAGVGEGARTGLASVVTGALLGATMLVTPIAAIVPAQAAAPALVVIGGIMMAQCRRIPFQDSDFTIPVFLTMAIVPFTYSITNGVGAGIVSYVVVKLGKGQWREVHWLVAVIAAIFVAYFGIAGIEALAR
jgi:AGZA family xanthine/uracil permease-like MFS transporter